MKRTALVLLFVCGCAGPARLVHDGVTPSKPASSLSRTSSTDASNTASDDGSAVTTKLDPILPLDGDPPGFALQNGAGQHLKGAIRVGSIPVSEIALGSIPRSSDVTSPSALAAGDFDLDTRNGGYRLVIWGDLLAEVEIDRFRAYTWAKIGQTQLAQARRLDYGVGLDDIHVGLPPKAATERGFRLGGFTASSATFIEYEATYDAAKRHGTATQARQADAVALWPGVIYAFVSPASTDDELGVLHVFGPATTWISAAPASPHEQLVPHVGSFSYATVRLKAGRSASITMSLTDLELDSFVRLRTGRSIATRGVQKKTGVGGDPPEEGATVRVLIDVDLDGTGGGLVHTKVDRLVPSKIVDVALKTAAPSSVASASPGHANKNDARNGSTLGTVVVAPPPQLRRGGGCQCAPSDSLCDCL